MGKKGKGTKYDSLFEARRRGERVSPAAGSETQGETGRVVRSRGGGKRSDSDYRQVSAYVRRDTYQRVKLALLEEERELASWLRNCSNIGSRRVDEYLSTCVRTYMAHRISQALVLQVPHVKLVLG